MYTYRILVVDDQWAGSSFKLKATGVDVAADICRTIDDALGGLVRELGGSDVHSHDRFKRHPYDIVLLDYEVQKDDYPIGGIALSPLYQKLFAGLGDPVVELYSSKLPAKCVDLYLLLSRVSQQKYSSTIFRGTVSDIDCSKLIEARAESIIAALSVASYAELKRLLRFQKEKFWSAELNTVRVELRADSLTLAQLRPDLRCDDFSEVSTKQWLRDQLLRSGYAFAAASCYTNQVVRTVAHHDVIPASDLYNPNLWIQGENVVIASTNHPGTFRVCPDLLAELSELPWPFKNSTERRSYLHRAFRLALGPLRATVQGYALDELAAEFAPDLKLDYAQDRLGDEYCYIHRKVMLGLLRSLYEALGGVVDLLPRLSTYVSREKGLVFVLLGKKSPINEEDIARIAEKISLSGDWGPYPALSDWGQLAIYNDLKWSLNESGAKQAGAELWPGGNAEGGAGDEVMRSLRNDGASAIFALVFPL